MFLKQSRRSRMNLGLASILAVLAAVFVSQPMAANAAGSDGTPDPAFVANIAAGSSGITNVQSVATQSTGKILVFGEDSTASIYMLIRLNSNGTVDGAFTQSTFAQSSIGNTGSIIVNSDDTFSLGGSFKQVIQGSTTTDSPYIAKFAANGLVDTTYAAAVSNSTTGIPHFVASWQSSYVFSAAVDSQGRALLAGQFFQSYGSGTPWDPATVSYWGAMRINADGSVDTTYLPFGGTSNSMMNAVSLGLSDSAFFAGWAGSNTVAKVLANGSIDTTFVPPTYTSNVYTIHVFADGKVLLGGGSQNADPALIAKLNSDGSLDGSFTPPSLTGWWAQIYQFAVQSDGRILAVGSFSTPNAVVRLSATGVIDSAFNANAGPAFNSSPYAVALTSTNEVLVGGSFTTPSTGITLLSNGPTYTVTYTNGGGAGSNLVQTIPQGTSITLPSATACPLSATDPCFTAPAGQRVNNSWYVSTGTITGGSSYPATGSSITPTSNVTLAARWTGGPVQYSTTSFSSGGTSMASIGFPNTLVNGSSQITVYAYNSGTASVSISNETLGGSGVTRQGGTCNASGGTIAAASQCTLILQWNPTLTGALSGGSYQMQVTGGYFDSVTLTGTAMTNKTVTFNSNNGTGSISPQTGISQATLTRNCVSGTCTITRAGYDFNGWNTQALGGGTPYADGANYDFLNSATMYAQWSAQTFVVTFNTGGGSSVSTGSFTTGGSLTLPAAPTQSGYTFNGWFTAATGGTLAGQAGANYTPSNAAALTLYAQWTASSSGGSGSSGANGGMATTGIQASSAIAAGSALIVLGMLAALAAWLRRRTQS